VVGCKKAKVHEELMSRICKGVATNRNRFGVELELKNFKVGLGKIGVVVLAKKMAHP
jgi:hypothetical protein